MSELIKPPCMFTASEWMCANKAKYGHANATREYAQNLDYECDRTLDEIKNRTRKTMDDVNKKLGTNLSSAACSVLRSKNERLGFLEK